MPMNVKCPHCGSKSLESSGTVGTLFCCYCANFIPTELVRKPRKPKTLVNEMTFPVDHIPDGTEIDGFTKTPHGWVQAKQFNMPDPGFLGLCQWVQAEDVMQHMLCNRLGFVIARDLVFEGDPHYQLHTITLKSSEANGGG